MATSTALGYNPSFNIGTGFDDSIYSIKIQSDGKILVGGWFTTFAGSSQNRLIRLNSDGSKDTSFDIGTGFNNDVESIAIQSDGKILVGGRFTTFTGSSQNRLIRLNSDGSKDSTFNIGSGFNSILVASIAIQSDGKILVGGSFTTFTGSSQNSLIRLNSDGSKDSTFNIGSGFNSEVNSVAIQSDGKILAGGAFTTFSGGSQNQLIRLNSDGSKDSTLDVGNGFNNRLYVIAIQSDGKILVGGSFTTFTGSSQNYFIRLNSNGSKDTSFDIGSGFNNYIESIAIQSDGKILVGGYYTTYQGLTQNYFIRLNSDGSKDTSFDIGTGFNDEVDDIAIQSDGKILAGGWFTTFAGSSQNRLIRLNSNGSIASGTTTITGTQQIGNLAVATATTANYSPSTNGGVRFWMGPDEDLGYVVGIPVPGGTQTTPVAGVNAFLGFIRSAALTEASFLSMVNGTFNQNFSTGDTAKTYLNNNGYWTSWTSPVFTSVWQTTTTNEVITLPYLSSGTYSGTIDWGDGSTSANSFSNISHTYATAGVKTIAISGVTKGFNFSNTRGSFTKLRDITNWGTVRLNTTELNSDNWFFYGCTGLTAITATDVLSTSGITNFSNMFRNCSSLTTVNRINEWNTSNVTTMQTMFDTATLFNSDIGNWDTRKVTNIAFMFSSAAAFNKNINSWNTSGFTDSYGAFTNATSFNQPLSGWNTSNLVSVGEMFANASAFNQNINNWNTSKFTSLFRTFYGASLFNQPLSGWNVSNVTNFENTFYAASKFNQNINNWVTSAATNMNGTFADGVPDFNQPLSGWNTSNVTSMVYMFGGNPSFNQSIGNWDVSKVTDMSSMFASATAFNQNIGSWNISGVTNFTSFMSGKGAANYSATNLDAIYNGWSTKTPKSGITITFNTIKYTSAGSSGRSVLTSAPYSWSITDGGI